MTQSEDTPSATELRRRAEAALRAESASPETLAALTPEAARALLHDLQVHQIELRMQNEELRRAQLEVETSRERYFDLYDLSPVGYVTIGETGLVVEANILHSLIF